MATAKKIVTPPAEPEFTVTIELSKDEARCLKGVLQAIGGDPCDTWRRHTQSVSEALGSIVGFVKELPTQYGSSKIYAKGPLPK